MKDYSFGNMVRASAWGALVGGAVGFTLGLLVAPEKGQKMRRRLIYQLEHLAEQVGEMIDQKISPEVVNSEARRNGDAVVAGAESEAQRILNDIEARLDELRRQGKQERKPAPVK